MTKKVNPIDDALGLTPFRNGQELVIPDRVVARNPEDSVDEAMDHIISARDLAMQAVQDVLMIAQQSQDHKAYATLNNLIKTYADVSMVPVNLENERQKLVKKDAGEEDKRVINNNLYVGSTADLLKMLKSNDIIEE